MPELAQIGRYRIEERLGAGGFGEVYRATAIGLGGVEKAIAIKLVREDLVSDPDVVHMFVEEAKLSFLLTHRNIVQTFDVGRADEQYFIAMEYVRGCNLQQVLAHFDAAAAHPLPLAAALLITAEVASGLDYAHRFGTGDGAPAAIVHRDISPSNILISLEGDVKIADFGIARSLYRGFRSQAGWLVGKPVYMSPEQLLGRSVDHRSDLFSLGAVLYEMLTGRLPYGQGDDPRSVIGALADYQAVPPSAFLCRLDPRLARGLDEVVLRAVAEHPEQRYPTAALLRDAVEGIAQQAGLRLSPLLLSDLVRVVEGGVAGSSGNPPRPRPDGMAGASPHGSPVAGALPDATDLFAPPQLAASPAPPASPAGAGTEAAALGARLDALLGSELRRVVPVGGEGPVSLYARATDLVEPPLEPRARPVSPLAESAPFELQPLAGELGLGSFRGAASDAAKGAAKGPASWLANNRIELTLDSQLTDDPAGSRRRGGVPWRGGLRGRGGWPAAIAAVLLVAAGAVAARVWLGPAASPVSLPVAGSAPSPASAAPPLSPAPPPAAASLPSPASAAAPALATPDAVAPPIADPAAASVPSGRRHSSPRLPAAAVSGLAPRQVPLAGRPAGRVAEDGLLSINSDPWATVSVDGRTIRSTPLWRHRLAAGSHRVQLENPVLGLQREMVVVIQAGKETILFVDLRRP